MMKKSILGTVVSFLLIFLFFACSNSQNSGESSSNAGTGYDNTLRRQFHGRFDSIAWTSELEPNLLADRKSSDSSLFSSKSLNTVAAASVISLPEEAAIYPDRVGLGTMDIRGMPADLTSMIFDFCSQLVSLSQQNNGVQAENLDEAYAELASLMASGRGYMVSVYMQDTATYPAASEFYLGTPFVAKEQYEVPVLFVSSQGSWIVVLYAALQEEAWKIEQIRYGDFVYE